MQKLTSPNFLGGPKLECLFAQGSSSSARLGGKAKYVCIVGLGKKDAKPPAPVWGVSPFMVLIIPSRAYTPCLLALSLRQIKSMAHHENAASFQLSVGQRTQHIVLYQWYTAYEYHPDCGIVHGLLALKESLQPCLRPWKVAADRDA